MKAKTIIFVVLVVLVCLVMAACGRKVMVAGRVVDAETGQPIEGAAVAIRWIHEKWGPPGLPTPKDQLGTTEELTDAQGNFTIPRYIGRTHFIGVYKKGYVCWSSRAIFNPDGKVYDEIFQKRLSHRVRDGMLIQLEPMPVDISSEQRERHAHFTADLDTLLAQTDVFFKAIIHEKELHIQALRKNYKEK